MKTDTVELWNIARQHGCKSIKDVSEATQINRNLVGAVMNKGENPTTTFMEKFVKAFNIESAKAGQIFFG